jgi:glycosyltransferase involved in cell wall biosynthesis
MRFVICSPGQAHSFDLAKVLVHRGQLERFFTCYPRRRVVAKGLPAEVVESHPLPFLAWYFGTRIVRSSRLKLATEPHHKIALDRAVARRHPACDVYLSMSCVGLESGRAAQRNGAIWVVDRPCSHILTQDGITREEYQRHGLTFSGVSRRVIERELAEYDAADAILVPSLFSERSFIERGVPAEKVWRIPFGVDLSRFQPAPPKPRDTFNVLFAGHLSLRKGVPYLLEAFERARIPNKALTLAGAPWKNTQHMVDQAVRDGNVRALGSIPQAELAGLMQQSDVLVLPSVEEGLALVQAQALACGCPVIGTFNSGAEDLVSARSGRVVPIRDPDAIARALEEFASAPIRADARDAAIGDAARLGGWDVYADRLTEKCRRLAEARSATSLATNARLAEHSLLC